MIKKVVIFLFVAFIAPLILGQNYFEVATATTTTSSSSVSQDLKNSPRYQRIKNEQEAKRKKSKINWPGGIPQEVAGFFNQIKSGPFRGEICTGRINIFKNSIQYDPKTDRIKALYYIEDMNFHLADKRDREDWILLIVIDPNSRTYKIEKSYAAKPHTNGPWYSNWEERPFNSMFKDFSEPWQKMITETDKILDQTIEGNYATLRDFNGKVLQKSDLTF
ncbi:hypothetical protein [uncultured Anaerovibrio sp.]|uniref:hypothetical protein n=1 Tax=uncultured Anaerovibrio sp. TaxID=361586 RepID=UPI002634B037|nr:hypothetical protein [uncultured Anaerovibrio sp.]